jgi:RNA polymerase sigma factor (sigma-70 family)
VDWLKEISKDHKEYVAIAKRMGAGSFAEDIIQEMYLRLINHANLQKLIKDGKCNKIYIYWTIRNTYLLKKNREFKFKENTEIENISLEYKDVTMKEESYTKILKKIDDEINTWHWYDKMLFELYRDSGKSIRELSKLTTISVKSIWQTLKHCKARIKEAVGEDWQDFRNTDYERIKIEQ